eukprot:GHRR01020341.1.p1 GENE.GHRR01020341.1~~GHRR01020341.1.p1  ORF type:complete len:351 (+),score=157.38 GHRR01020341.1:3409-4461(+)
MALHTTRALQPSAQLLCNAGAAVVLPRKVYTAAPFAPELAASRSSALTGRFTPFGASASPARLRIQRLLVMAAAAGGFKGRALVSVSDKTSLDELAKGLAAAAYEIVSTGGSAKAIEGAGVDVRKVEDLTGFPEMLDGRVKTLHPGVHGGILAIRGNADHMAALQQHNISTIDVVVVNLYPFRATVTRAPPPPFEEGVENIDIGGPAMIRAAAKNHAHVTVIVDPADYPELLGQLAAGEVSAGFRKKMAWKAYQHTASYDSQVGEWLWGQVGGSQPAPALSVPMKLAQGLRYGENPHQAAAFYTDESLAEAGQGGIATAVQHHGKEMSFNNYLDADAAYNCCCDFKVGCL